MPRGLGGNLYVSADRPEVIDNLLPDMVAVAIPLTDALDLVHCRLTRVHVAGDIGIVADRADVASSRDLSATKSGISLDFIRRSLRFGILVSSDGEIQQV